MTISQFSLPAGDATPLPTEAAGVVLYPAPFEAVVALLRRGIDTLASVEDFPKLAIPPVVARSLVERAGYVQAFPQLLGTVHSFAGTPAEWKALSPEAVEGGDWHSAQTLSDLVLLPAACYPVYATLAGTELAEPSRFAVEGQCFRQEATSETGRLRSFRMVELVTAGTEQHCLAWRGTWLERVAGWLEGMSLKVEIEVADDPFFGPARRLFQAAQRKQELKYELRVEVADGLVQAIASANFHKDHFGEVFGFTSGGAVGNTACTAFGIERIALALLHAHGARPAEWPDSVISAICGGN
ncbi:class-II aminoacyl-tRNA synthetase family protein [Streptacidiphilus sp. PAMC 29251]